MSNRTLIFYFLTNVLESNQDTRAIEEQMIELQTEAAGEETRYSEGPDPRTIYLEVNSNCKLSWADNSNALSIIIFFHELPLDRRDQPCSEK